MGGEFNIALDATNARALFARLADFGADPPLLDSARALEQRVRQTFRGAADPYGNPWPAHSPVTIAARQRAKNFSTQLLIESGALYDSLHSEQIGEGAQVTIGGPGMFPGVQQDGNPNNLAWGRGYAPIPARGMFPMREDIVDLPEAWAADMLAPIATKLAEVIQ